MIVHSLNFNIDPLTTIYTSNTNQKHTIIALYPSRVSHQRRPFSLLASKPHRLSRHLPQLLSDKPHSVAHS